MNLTRFKPTCGNCKGLWPIAGTALNCLDEGRAMVKDLARVYCPCGQNFLYASGSSPFLWSEGGGTNEPAQASTQRQTCDQRFHVTNPHTGQPLRDMLYRIVTDDGEELEGRTDAQGYTQRVTSDQAISATLHVLEEVTPLRPDWDKYL